MVFIEPVSVNESGWSPQVVVILETDHWNVDSIDALKYILNLNVFSTVKN